MRDTKFLARRMGNCRFPCSSPFHPSILQKANTRLTIAKGFNTIKDQFSSFHVVVMNWRRWSMTQMVSISNRQGILGKHATKMEEKSFIDTWVYKEKAQRGLCTVLHQPWERWSFLHWPLSSLLPSQVNIDGKNCNQRMESMKEDGKMNQHLQLEMKVYKTTNATEVRQMANA